MEEKCPQGNHTARKQGHLDLKFQLQKLPRRFFQVHGYSVSRELPQESEPSSRCDTVFEVYYKKIYQKLMPQLSHQVPSGLSLSSHSPRASISFLWTSTMPLSKLTSRIQSGYIFPDDTNPRQPQLLAYDSRKAFMVSNRILSRGQILCVL